MWRILITPLVLAGAVWDCKLQEDTVTYVEVDGR